MSHFYRIKPLKWEILPNGMYATICPFNNFRVLVYKWMDSWGYSINGSTCAKFPTAEAAMKAAEKTYVKQLQQVLEEVSV